MDGETRALLLGDRGDLAYERDEVRPQVFERHVLVRREHAPEAFPVIGEIARRQPVDERSLKLLLFAWAHRLAALTRGHDTIRIIVALGVFAPEDEKVVSREIDRVEAQSRAAVRKRPIEIGPRPVSDGHEIVAEGFHPGARGVAYRLLVIIDLAAIVAAARLDRLA